MNISGETKTKFRAKLISLLFLFSIFFPAAALASETGNVQNGLLQVPSDPSEFLDPNAINATAYTVVDVSTGKVLMSKNSDMVWTPASLTKLVTALVVLDSKVKLNKVVAMSSYDQSLGECGNGGVCIKAKPGVKFRVDGLFHAALMLSANNAASALARSTGLSTEAFAAKMNKKATELGATSSHFVEPTGMSPENKITASDYAKIVTAAFSNSYLRQIGQLNSFRLVSYNNSKYNQTIKNTDKLLGVDEVQVLGGKTGYIGSVSGYNFGTLLKPNNGTNQKLAIVVLGEPHMWMAYSDIKQLASIAHLAQVAFR